MVGQENSVCAIVFGISLLGNFGVCWFRARRLTEKQGAGFEQRFGLVRYIENSA